MYASRSSGLACRSRLVASHRATVARIGHASRVMTSVRGFSQTLVSHQKGGQKDTKSTEPTSFKIDDAIDEYKDVTATNEQMEANYREPPLVMAGKHGEYANTLYATASVLNAVDAVDRDLQWIREAVSTSSAFQQFLSAGLSDKKLQRLLLQGVLKGAGFNRLTQKFIVTELLEAGDLKLLSDIATAYAQIMKAHRKEVPVVFTFASLPDKDFLARQIQRVKKYRMASDLSPQWQFKIDPALIGGFTVEVGNSFTGNFSLAHQFNYMREQFEEIENKWERVKPKTLDIKEFDTSNFDAPLTLSWSEKKLLEEAHQLDLDKFKKLKELDLVEHEKYLLKKHKIADTDQVGKAKVKAKIEQLKLYQSQDLSPVGYVLKKYEPNTYKKYESIFAH